MTCDLTQIPYQELDRIHEQTKIGLTWALSNADEGLYRGLDDLEQRARREKVRRMRRRGGPA